MKRFDICAARGLGVTGNERLVVILQHKHFKDLDTTIVAPLYRIQELPILETLRPSLSVGRKKLIVAIDRMVSLPKKQLGAAVGTAENIQFEILRAIDRLFSGF